MFLHGKAPSAHSVLNTDISKITSAKNLFKDDRGHISRDYNKIMLKMFLAHNLHHAIFHLTINLLYVLLHTIKGKVNEFYYIEGRQGLDYPENSKPSRREVTS